MPIYEFYCTKCNTVYKFFSKTVNTRKTPACPSCKKPKLKRLISSFATLSGRTEDETDDDMPPIDEARMERAMAMLAREAGNIREDDPRAAARLMRKLSDAAGVNFGPGMEEALSRLERGEDPEAIEHEMGDLLEGEEPFIFGGKGPKTGRKERPKFDEKLYDL